MTADATTLRIPPAIRRRLDGIEAELRPTPQRVPLVGGRPTLYVVDDRVGGRVRPVHRVRRAAVRPARSTRSGWFGAMAGVAAVLGLVAVVGLGALGGGPVSSAGPSGFGGSSGSGPSGSASGSGSSASASSGSSASATSSAAASADLGPPSGPLPLLTPFPSLVDIQVIRVAADPATAAMRVLRTSCVTKESGLDAADEKKLLTRAFANKITGGWVDDAHTVFIAADSIDAAQAFGATVLVEGPDETWAVGRDDKGRIALLLQDMPTIDGRQAWWWSMGIRPVACP